MFLFRTETNECGTQIVVHLPQGFKRVRRHHPFQVTRTGSDSELEASEGTVLGVVVTALATSDSARSTSVHASRTSARSVICWQIPACDGWNCTCTRFWRRTS